MIKMQMRKNNIRDIMTVNSYLLNLLKVYYP